jgi:hypothetical protein
VSPASGTLTAGQTRTITVTTSGDGPANFTNTLTVNPGQTVTVTYPPRG